MHTYHLYILGVLIIGTIGAIWLGTRTPRGRR